MTEKAKMSERSNIEQWKFFMEFEDTLETKTFKSLTFSAIDADYKKARIEPKFISDNLVLQAEFFYTEGRVKHRNISFEEIGDFVESLMDISRHADLDATSGQATLLVSKKGEAKFISRINHRIREQAGCFVNTEGKNRVFNGNEEFMKFLGISDTTGRVHDKKQGKFRQINRFAMQVHDIMKYLPDNKTLFVADLCCGKSYLSFALYHYLTAVLNRKIHMLCIDLKESVINYCASCASQLGFDGMEFVCSDISNYKFEKSPDLVISLHACDSATDIVLDSAIAAKAKVILSTPCCQRELASIMNCTDLSFISDYPHLKMKFCAVATDALRGKRLEAAGYKVDIFEFTDPDDTPKNTMIRAVAKNVSDMSSFKMRKALKNYFDSYAYITGNKPKRLPPSVSHRDTEKELKNAFVAAENSINSANEEERVEFCKTLQKLFEKGFIPSAEFGSYVNNHIHTTYSFSPYTPASAVYNAKKAGLRTCGIMDHDSVSGASEFAEAGKIFKIPTTCGCEMRVKFDIPAYSNRRLNNPDQVGCAYVALHGIPSTSLGEVSKFLVPFREARNERNKEMISNINSLSKSLGINITFEGVKSLSFFDKGGSITERHVLFALVKELVSKYPNRNDCITAIEELSGSTLSEKKKKLLITAPDDLYSYDILGVMKSGLIEKIYVPATGELPSVYDFISLAKRTGAISAYAYLGDVGESPTGDKKAQKFEDDYLDELFDDLKSVGFNAVTFMPSRNTPSQLKRVMSLCRDLGFFMISGEDINSPRQSFICEAAESSEFSVLKDATWALIGHEISASEDIGNAMFSDSSHVCGMTLEEKIDYYSEIGKNREIEYNKR